MSIVTPRFFANQVSLKMGVVVRKAGPTQLAGVVPETVMR
jgi:hypothetical protein